MRHESPASGPVRSVSVPPGVPGPVTVDALGPAAAAAATDVLSEAFRDYPVMRYVLGSDPEYDRRLRVLFEFFLAARLLRQEPVLGVLDGTAVVGVAAVTLPGARAAPPELARLRESVWATLGAAARARYETFGTVTGRFTVSAPHHHLNMIGVRRSHAGRGWGRRLVDAVHDLAAADSGSAGVSLTTESPANVALYRHLGYQLLGHAPVADRLETWAFFRPSHRPAGRGAGGDV